MQEVSSSTVLVSGGSGFVASHLILRLLELGYAVRTTLRSLSSMETVREVLRKAGVGSLERLTFYVADLNSDNGWIEAIQGSEFVLHVASPFPQDQPELEDELTVPAKDGTLRVLRLARDVGVKRVDLTSSFAAIGYGTHKDVDFTEEDWSNVHSIPAYHKSKTLAEKAAWDFVKKDGDKLELTAINPVGIFGPILGINVSTSTNIIKSLGESLGLPEDLLQCC